MIAILEIYYELARDYGNVDSFIELYPDVYEKNNFNILCTLIYHNISHVEYTEIEENDLNYFMY